MRSNGCIDSNQFALCVHQSATTITGIDSSISLNKRFHRRTFTQNAKVTCLSTHDTRSDSGSQVERITNGKHPFTNANIVGVTKGKVFQIRSIHLNQSQVGGRVSTNNSSRFLHLIIKGNLHFIGTFNNVVIGDDISIGG